MFIRNRTMLKIVHFILAAFTVSAYSNPRFEPKLAHDMTSGVVYMKSLAQYSQGLKEAVEITTGDTSVAAANRHNVILVSEFF